MTLFINTENKKLYIIHVIHSNFPIPCREPEYKLATQLIGSQTIRITTDEEFEIFRPIGVL